MIIGMTQYSVPRKGFLPEFTSAYLLSPGALWRAGEVKDKRFDQNGKGKPESDASTHSNL